MQFFKKRNISNEQRLLAVSLGHFMNDFYMALIPPVLFLFAKVLSLTLTQQGIIAFVITSSGSFAQPVVGYIVDKKGKPWLLIVAVLWIAFWMSLSGIVTNYYLLIFIVGMGALASSLFHPLGTATAVKLGKQSQGRSLALFMTIGGFAAAVAPMIAIPIVNNYGLSKLGYLIIPGILIALVMYYFRLQEMELDFTKNKKKTKGEIFNIHKSKWVAALVFVSTNRVVIRRSMVAFGVQLLLIKNVDIKIATLVLSLHLFLVSAGTLIGGYLCDIIGSRRVIIICNLMASFCVLTMVFSSDSLISLIAFIFLGFSLSGSNTANVTLTQNLLPQNMNMATGLVIGFAGGVGGLGILLYAKLADIYGLLFTTGLLIVPLILVNILTLLLPKEAKKQEKVIDLKA